MCARVSQVRACEPVPPERKKEEKKDNKLLDPPFPFPFPYPRHRDPDPELIGKTKRLKRQEIQRRGRKVPGRLVSRRLGSRLCHDYDRVLVTIPIDWWIVRLSCSYRICLRGITSYVLSPPPFTTQYPYVLRAAVRGRRPPLPGPMSMLCSSRLSAMSSFCMRSSSGTLAGMGGAP
jgi:hypothetical protein